MPSHQFISDKFLIRTERYLKVVRAKYDRDKKALADKSYFTKDQDMDIEMTDSDLDEDEHSSIDSDDDNLYFNQEEARAGRLMEL